RTEKWAFDRAQPERKWRRSKNRKSAFPPWLDPTPVRPELVEGLRPELVEGPRGASLKASTGPARTEQWAFDRLSPNGKVGVRQGSARVGMTIFEEYKVRVPTLVERTPTPVRPELSLS